MYVSEFEWWWLCPFHLSIAHGGCAPCMLLLECDHGCASRGERGKEVTMEPHSKNEFIHCGVVLVSAIMA